MKERLQKIIARAGIASRRRAEDLIVSGQVEVNGKVVTELGAKADPERDVIRVAGRRLKFPERRIVLALNKPDACVSALTDPQGRATLRDFLHGVAGRVYPVGGLEYHSTGLVILTSDGAFAERLFRALGRGLRQTYHMKVKNPLSSEDVATIARRIGPIRTSRSGLNPWYEVRLAGERKDLLRKLLLEMGHPVEKLKRVAIARIELSDLKSGRWRALSDAEIRSLEDDMERPGRGRAASVKAPGRNAAGVKSHGAGKRPLGKRRGRGFDREKKLS
jgi:23S rRNA pseudouridine2605 synthase